MIRKVIVLGGGSTGLLAALTLKAKLPRAAVTLVRPPLAELAEATTGALPRHLFGLLRLDPAEFHRAVQPSWKLGTRFLWGPRTSFDFTFGNQLDMRWSRLSKNNGFYCQERFDHADQLSALMSRNKAFVRAPNGDPLIGLVHGYHLDPVRFIAYLARKAAERGVEIVEEALAEAKVNTRGIAGLKLASGAEEKGDLYVDCSGERSELLGRALAEPFVSFDKTLFNDRMVVGGWSRAGEPIQPYTAAETMEAGWCWRIDLPDSIQRGYAFSSRFLSDSEAEEEFRVLNPKVRDARVIGFASGRYQRSWVKNVVAIGDAAGFVEPLESTRLAVALLSTRLVAEALEDGDGHPTPTQQACLNHVIAETWDSLRSFLGLHFKFNTRFDTPYWKAARAKADLGNAAPIVEYFKQNGPSTYGRTALLGAPEHCGMEGYLCMLVGQKVPYKTHWTPLPEELAIWDGVRAEHRARALTGVTVEEALRVIARDNYRWDASWVRPPERTERSAPVPGALGDVFA